MGDVTVGIDIGTTSVKALAVDDEGDVIASVRRPHPLLAGPDRLAHDADVAWRQGVVEAFGAVSRKLTVRAASVAAMVPSLTAVDGAGRPCGPGLLYGDERGPEAAEAARFLGWLAGEHPDAAGYWPAQAVANHALCGRAAVDYATAYCLMPVFDGSGWADEVVERAGARSSQLPAVVADVTEPVGRLSGGGAGDQGLLGAGTVDALAAQYVLGADAPGDVIVLLGATLIVWLVTPEWVERPGLWTVPHTAPGLTLVGGASNAGGLFLDWASGLLGAGHRVDPPSLPAGAGGQLAPFEAVDRSGRPSGGGGGGDAAPAGLLATGGGDVDRSVPPAGGGVRRPGWVEALADCTGLPVDVAAVPDATALGSAFLARCVAGLESTPTDGRRWARTSRRVEPDPAWVGPCAERYRRFRVLGEAAMEAAE